MARARGMAFHMDETMKYQFNMPPEWIRTSTLEAALREKGHSTLVVSKPIAAALARLQQLANVAAQGTAPAIARVDLRTWAVTLETTEEEQMRKPDSTPTPIYWAGMKIGDEIRLKVAKTDGTTDYHYRVIGENRFELVPESNWQNPRWVQDCHIVSAPD